jgi:putative endonuclease
MPPAGRIKFDHYILTADMLNENQELGRLGEELAADYLVKHSLKVLRRNVRRGTGEIDILALEGETVVFIEVKTSAATSPVRPEDQLTRTKKLHIARTALKFIQEKRLLNNRLRIDLLGIIIDAEGKAEFNHIKNAFEPGEVIGGLMI